MLLPPLELLRLELLEQIPDSICRSLKIIRNVKLTCNMVSYIRFKRMYEERPFQSSSDDAFPNQARK